MANHKSAEKRIRTAKDKKEANHYKAKTMRSAVKTLRNMTEKAEIEKGLPKVVAMVDKLASKKVIHKNKAANLKSKLMKKAAKAKA